VRPAVLTLGFEVLNITGNKSVFVTTMNLPMGPAGPAVGDATSWLDV